MSGNAVEAARQAGLPLLRLRRPPWSAVAGDRWIDAADVREAVAKLGESPRRVFVALGRNELAPFNEAPQHFYLVRSVDPVDPPLPLPRVVLRDRARAVQRSRRPRPAARAARRDGNR